MPEPIKPHTSHLSPGTYLPVDHPDGPVVFFFGSLNWKMTGKVNVTLTGFP